MAKKTHIREDIEWAQMYRHNDPDNTKERILLIGDSIVVGHGRLVHGLLEDKYCVDFYSTSYCVSDEDFMAEYKFALSKKKYKAIIFNNGLHGFDIDEETYAENLKEVLEFTKTQAPTVAWRSSTPVRSKENLDEFNEEKNPRVIIRNEDAKKIAEELGLPILDLYTPMAENKDYFSPDAIHYLPEGQKVQAKMIADFILSII
jgi:hypothetical protein